MRILIDTNVLIDYLTGRMPYFTLADNIIHLCSDAKIKGFMAAHSINDMYYILRKEYDDTTRREMLRSLFDILEVSGLDKNILLKALERNYFKDFEDCIQDECASVCKVDFIVTRNVKDFETSTVKAISPDEFMDEYNKTLS